jgi:hypothetical protein
MRTHGIFAVVVGVLCAGAGGVRGQSAPASQRALVGSPLEKVHAALELSPKEQMVLSTLRDGTETTEHNAFYLMMAKVADLPSLTSAEIRGLDAPAVANLLRRPGHYRCQPRRGLTASPYWPQDRPIYRVYGTFVGGEEPVIVYCPAVPPDLPKPSAVDRDGEMQFKNGPQYDVTGVFFQTIRCFDRPRDDQTTPQMRDYPVILAWRVSPARGAMDVASGRQAAIYLGGVILLAILCGGALFVFLQKRIARGRTKGQPTFGGYRPLRDVLEEQTERPAGPEPVDPDLAAAAEEHRKLRLNEGKPD